MTSQIPIIAVGNLKGGVGKTTIAANLGAYIADGRDRAAPNRDLIDGPQRPVLFIDLDFQGSLSATLLNQIGGANQNRAALLFDEDATPAGLLSRAPRLVGPDLPVVEGCRFFDCGYEAAALEDRLLFDWAVTQGAEDDLRLRLARFLHSQDVQTRFRAVVLDLPPRSTTFAINALCAATDLVIPMRADALSSEAVGLFMQQLESLRERLWPTLSIAGLVGVMTEGAEPSRSERLVLAEAADDARKRWSGEGGRIRVLTTVPSRAHIGFSAGKSFAYFNHRDGDVGATPHDIFLDVGRRVVAALSRAP